MKKRISSVILSCIIWGSGQFFIAKKRVRGLLFFLVQFLTIAVELFSGYWLNFFAGQIDDFNIGVYGGFFTKGIWGLITLGETPGFGGDHSTLLLNTGILTLLVLLIILGVFAINIKDAYTLGKQIDLSGKTNLPSPSIQRRRAFPYLVLSPFGILIIIVVLMPILFSVLIAFTNYDINHMPPAQLVRWVGFGNLQKIVGVDVWARTFVGVLLWTIVWAVSLTAISYMLGLFQALILNSNHVKHPAFFRTFYILPWAIPGMITLLVFRNLLNGQFGPINQFLYDFHIIQSRIPFLTDPTIAKFTVILVNVWMCFPQFMVMMLGILANQDTTLYEAAEIDGANKMQVFTRIKLPLVTRAVAPLIIMNLGANFNAFGSIYFLTQGGVPANPSYQCAGDTDILISWVYKLTLDQQMYNMAGVMNIFIFAFIAAFSIWSFRRTNTFKEM